MAETVINQSEPKTENKVETLQRQNHQLKRVIGVILSVVMIVLTVYVLSLQNQNATTLIKSADLALTASDHASTNYRTYVEKYKTTKSELDETTKKLIQVNQQLDQVTEELTSTKGLLTQTQGMLADAQQENIKLKQELQGLDNLRSTENVQNIDELQSKIQTLKNRDTEVSLQLADLKTQLRAFEAQFSTFDQGKSLINLFQGKIRLVKTRMHYLKEEAFVAKVAAQKEKDRIAALNGNSGFVVRDGKPMNPNGTNKSFAIDVKLVQ